MFKDFIKRHLAFWTRRKFIYSVPFAPRNAVALTFDDGPHPENTGRILEILRRHAVKATFFVSGNAAERYPHLLKAIHDEGHEIGNHGYEHVHVSAVSRTRYVDNVCKTTEIVSALAGQTPVFFRPPYGELSLGIARMILSHRLSCVMWSRDSRDSFIKESGDLLAYLKTRSFGGGDIVLFHDDQRQTVEILDQFLSWLAESGITVQPLAHLLRIP